MSKLEELIIGHAMRRPKAEAQDIYKLLYQGVFGVGHIFSERAMNVLIEEAGRINIDDHPEDPLMEPVSPDGSIVRVNLRQYIKAGGDLSELYEAMRESAEVKGEVETFLSYWAAFKKLIDDGVLNFPRQEIKRINKQIEAEGVKQRHHTEAYREAYYPAYRVVSRKIFVDKAVSVGSVKNHFT